MVVGINCGHTISGCGYGAEGIFGESEHTRLVGQALMEKFRTVGADVVDCTVDIATSQNKYLVQTVAKANHEKLDWFVSIHFNASPMHNGHGVEVFTYKGRRYPEAVSICEKMAELGFRNRGVKNGSGLYVVRKTKAKAMLVEVCFCDNAKDAKLYKQVGAEAVAQAIFDAIWTNSI